MAIGAKEVQGAPAVLAMRSVLALGSSDVNQVL